ncbi:hypothetical protein HanIR_Chr09g0406271 [Helianthus annuus]|nr:hypothetical protein HanIR_Chr09g0406271 [Helianthus annuus]
MKRFFKTNNIHGVTKFFFLISFSMVFREFLKFYVLLINGLGLVLTLSFSSVKLLGIIGVC